MLVLTEQVITSLFQNLSQKDAVSYQETLLNALKEYELDPSIIPQRIVTTTQYNCTHLFMASTGTHVGMKAITGSKQGFKGITTILDRETGYPLGIINCATLTAFRTALCNSLPLVKYFPLDIAYSNDDKLIVFGVGDQAIWHIRLTLILYPNRFTNVVIVNRTFQKAQDLATKFTKEYPSVLFTAFTIGDESLNKEFCDASIIYSCIPTSTPTVTKKLMDNCTKRCFIATIGSYKPHMTEIDADVLNSVINNGNKIIVDSVDHCLHEAGEFIINGIGEDSLIDISTLYTSPNASDFLNTSQIAISKLVGLCIMDVWVGQHCLEMARNMGVGIEIDNF